MHVRKRLRPGLAVADSLMWRTARKASCGMSTRPTRFLRFLPSFCFSSSLRLRVMAPSAYDSAGRSGCRRESRFTGKDGGLLARQAAPIEGTEEGSRFTFSGVRKEKKVEGLQTGSREAPYF